MSVPRSLDPETAAYARWRLARGYAASRRLPGYWLMMLILLGMVLWGREWGQDHAPTTLRMLVFLLALGIAAWLSRFFRSRDISGVACLLVPWAALAAGVALTTPVGGHRLLVLTPLWALAAGSGLFALARWLAMAWRPKAGRVFWAVIVGILVTLSVSDLRWSATEERQPVYTENRTTLAWDMGWRLSQHDPGSATMPMVLFAGPPMMFSDGWGNLRFLAPDLKIADVEAPFTEASTEPELADNTVLILIGERGNERCAAERLYADASVAEVHARDGALLYVMFFHEPLSGWSSATTPAETTFTVVTESECSAEAAQDAASGRATGGLNYVRTSRKTSNVASGDSAANQLAPHSGRS